MAARHNLSDRLYDAIHSAIIGGEYPEGTRLPPEKELSERYALSRPVVREALARLRSEGLIRSRKGSGSYVLKRLAVPPRLPEGVGSIAEIEECFEFRLSIEGENAYFAALRRTEEDLAEIRRQFDAFCKETRSQFGGITDDFNFHVAIARATHNQFLLYSFLSIEQHVLFSIGVIRRLTALPLKDRRESLIAEHEAILNAIVEQDGKKARSAMKRHVRRSKIRIFEGRNA